MPKLFMAWRVIWTCKDKLWLMTFSMCWILIKRGKFKSINWWHRIVIGLKLGLLRDQLICIASSKASMMVSLLMKILMISSSSFLLASVLTYHSISLSKSASTLKNHQDQHPVKLQEDNFKWKNKIM